ncbi:MAG TPA: MlaD family protein [Negativicutes bacterium]|nr:MlaD family protein [Negativicutes bacterium]
MIMNAETKVGAVTLLGIALLVGIAIFYGAIRVGETGYPLHVDFDRVDGLKLGGQVRYAGVDVGRVVSIGMTDEGKARATLRIFSGNLIPVGSDFGIGSDGLLGEKFVSISPPDKRETFFKPDEVVTGSPSQGMETLISTADRLFNRLDKLAIALESVFGDPNVQGSLKESARNIDQLTAALSRMAVNNEQNVSAIAGNLAVMSASLRNVASRVDKMAASVDNDGKFAKDLNETLSNLRSASARIEKMAAALEPVATDPETAGNIKTTLKNAREVSEKANRLLNKIEKIKTEAGIDVMYSGGAERYRTNVDVRVHTDEKSFVHMGLSDIGESNRFNFQVGRQEKDFGGRVGVIEGKAGAGLDLRLGKNVKFSADAYDPNDFRIKLRSELRIAPDTYLVGESTSINKDAQRNSYIGVRRTF